MNPAWDLREITEAEGHLAPSEAERQRMAQRILEVGALSEFVLALRDAVQRQTNDR